MPYLRLVVGFVVASLLIAVGVWAGHESNPTPSTITKYVDRVVTQTITVKPDGTTTTTVIDSTSVKPPPADPKPNYSVQVTSPMSNPAVQRVGVELGRRVVGDVWGVIGYQEDQGAHIGVRVEF